MKEYIESGQVKIYLLFKALDGEYVLPRWRLFTAKHVAHLLSWGQASAKAEVLAWFLSKQSATRD